MSKLVLVAGPQAAGKSTVIANLREGHQKALQFFPQAKLPSLVTLQETRQIIVHKYMLSGAIFMTRGHEAEIVLTDLHRMDTILEHDDDNTIYVDECNVFTIAHAMAHGISDVEQYWEEYLRRLARLDAEVIFLNVPPAISWQRRQKHYEQRLLRFPKRDRPAILARYEEYLKKLYPQLLDLYHRLPLSKQMIDGCLPSDTVVQKVIERIIEPSLRPAYSLDH